jgi:branched-chain amino acid transport system ATP-binding protein
MLLDVKDLSKSFGGIRAVRGISLGIEDQSISSIIGPNGAGKTTFFNLLTGIYKPDTGAVTFNGKSVLGFRPDQVNAAGIARTFQSIRLFPTMSVLENVMVGAHSRLRVSLWQTLSRNGAFQRQEDQVRDKASGLLHFVGLGGYGDEVARNLPYGAQSRQRA